MSADFEDIVKQGYLKVKSRNLGTWNKRWIILKKSSSKGEKRIEKYQDEKSSLLQKEDGKPTYLTDVKAVSRLPNDIKKHAFAFVFNDSTSRQYASDSDLDADDWHTLILKQLQGGTAAGPNIDILSNGQQTDDCFNVYLLPSPNLDIYGECILQVTHEHINIWDVVNTSKKLVSWPLTSLRRYGKDENKFTLEAGRHCDTGQGLFVFNTSQGSKMYEKVHSASVTIAEAHRIVSKQNEPPRISTRPPVLRVNSEKSPPPVEFHAKIKPSASFPGERAPFPLPPVPPLTANRNPVTSCTPLKDIEVDGGDYETHLLSRPLPPPPVEAANNSANRGSRAQKTSTSTTKSSGLGAYANGSIVKPTEETKLGLAAAINNNNNNIDIQEEIYEEKYLEPAFKHFLSRRKEDDADA